MLILLTITTLITVIVTTIIISWYKICRKFKCLEKIPGPKPWPIIGNSNLVGTTTVGLLHSFMQLQLKYGPLYKLWMGPRLHLMVTKPEAVEFFLNSTVHLSKSEGYNLFKPWLGDGLLVSTGSKWKSRRKMITPTFHFKILEQFMDVFNNQLNILLNTLTQEVEKNGNFVQILKPINLCSLDIICETAFGISINAQSKSNPKYVEAVTGFLEIFTLRFFSGWLRNPLIFRFSSMYKQYYEYLNILHAFTNEIIKQRKADFQTSHNITRKTDDGIKRKAALLDMLLEAANIGEYSLNDEDIREEVDTFMFEGHDTSSTAICFVLLALAEHPNTQKKVYDELIDVLGSDSKSYITVTQINELKYLDIVVKEALRIYPPVPLIERSLEEDCIVDGLQIPKDTNISIFLYGMNYSSEVFPEPEKFDPERFLPENQTKRHNYAYVPFSAGPRNCIGQKFALLELKASIAKILRQFELRTDPSFTPQIGMCSVLKSKNGIRMQLIQRKQN